jgi:hypothetical protein
VLEAEAVVERHLGGIDLNDVARRLRQVVLGLANTVRTAEGLSWHPGVSARSFYETAALAELSEDASDHRGGTGPAMRVEDDGELVLAPTCPQAQLQYRLLKFTCPCGFADASRSAATVFEPARPTLAEAPAPAVKSIASDAEALAG